MPGSFRPVRPCVPPCLYREDIPGDSPDSPGLLRGVSGKYPSYALVGFKGGSYALVGFKGGVRMLSLGSRGFRGISREYLWMRQVISGETTGESPGNLHGVSGGVSGESPWSIRGESPGRLRGSIRGNLPGARGTPETCEGGSRRVSRMFHGDKIGVFRVFSRGRNRENPGNTDKLM